MTTRSTAPANELDFLGEGTAAAPAAAPPPAAPTDPSAKGVWEANNRAAQTRDLATRDTAGYNPTAAQTAYEGGNVGGASGAYNAGTQQARDYWDKNHAGGTHSGQQWFEVGNLADIPIMQDLVTKPLEQAAVEQANGGRGVTADIHGGDRGGMGLNGAYSVQMDRATGLGDSARQLGADVLGGSVAAPNAADAAAQGDALDRAMAFAPKATDAAAKSAAGFSPTATTAAMKGANAFAQGPKAASGVLGKVDAFAAQPEGPSSAQLLQDEASQKAMSDVLAASRSGRARDAGSMARASNMAQAELAGMGVDNARSAALLRSKEANDARAQQLSALGLSGDLAQGLDTTQLGTLNLAGDLAKSADASRLGGLNLQGDLAKSRDASALGALNLGGDLATQMRQASATERGQTLDFAQGQQQIGAGLEGDVLKTIPALEQIRHDDQFELTPEQKIAQAQIGAPKEKTTTDYVTGLIGDILGVL